MLCKTDVVQDCCCADGVVKGVTSLMKGEVDIYVWRKSGHGDDSWYPGSRSRDEKVLCRTLHPRIRLRLFQLQLTRQQSLHRKEQMTNH